MAPRSNRGNRYSTPLILGALAAAVFVIYAPVWQFEFIRGDDGSYVNTRVLDGLTPSNVAWAFSTFESSNWHPLTWLSLMLDAEIGSGGPALFHVTNLVLHLANSILLFLFFSVRTGCHVRSFFVALLFAVHPLHVESVAWVSERKDVLSTLFWMLTILAYLRYRKQPSPRRYLVVALAFGLGLMAKPMLVTLPLVLLLLDYWPLGRVGNGKAAAVADKLPLLLLALASCAVTLYAQAAGGAVGTLEKYPLGLRVANGLTSYARYIGKTFWPTNLAPQYPYNADPSPWLIVASAILLAGLSWIVIRAAAVRPYLVVGWLWFLGTLVPVIGLVQVGQQAMADRYMYIPSIGLFVVVAWAVPDMLERAVPQSRRRTIVLTVAMALVAVALVGSARIQTGYWRNSRALFTHTVETAPGNVMAHVNLGVELQQMGLVEQAIPHYRDALRADPAAIQPRVNLAAALVETGRLDDAIAEYREALRHAPQDSGARTSLGLVLLNLKRYAAAETELKQTLRLDPVQPVAWKSLGIAVFRQGRLDEAIAHFSEALRLDPTQDKIRRDLQNLRRMAERD